MHAYWRAANYLLVGQIYLQDNPLLETPLRLENIKPRLLGHWGTTPGEAEHRSCGLRATATPGERMMAGS
jgi:phosphoketolase